MKRSERECQCRLDLAVQKVRGGCPPSRDAQTDRTTRVAMVNGAEFVLAAEIEERFALHISMIASGILKREIGIVLVLPNEFDAVERPDCNLYSITMNQAPSQHSSL